MNEIKGITNKLKKTRYPDPRIMINPTLCVINAKPEILLKYLLKFVVQAFPADWGL